MGTVRKSVAWEPAALEHCEKLSVRHDERRDFIASVGGDLIASVTGMVLCHRFVLITSDPYLSQP
jgi:hypothetical protein